METQVCGSSDHVGHEVLAVGRDVVVPVKDQQRGVTRLLVAFQALEPSARPARILIVDNNSQPPIEVLRLHGSVGAARYFISPNDVVPDERASVGLDDDVEVFNHVVLDIGRPDLVISE